MKELQVCFSWGLIGCVNIFNRYVGPCVYAQSFLFIAQQRRSFSGVFAGKYGLITLRDLFRWAERYRCSMITDKFHDWEQQLAEDGIVIIVAYVMLDICYSNYNHNIYHNNHNYSMQSVTAMYCWAGITRIEQVSECTQSHNCIACVDKLQTAQSGDCTAKCVDLHLSLKFFNAVGFMLLGGKLRNPTDKSAVLEVIQKHFRRTVIESHLFGSDGGNGSVATGQTLKLLKSSLPLEFSHLVWTPELLMMAVLVHRALSFNEPVLIIGGTGYVEYWFI